MRRLMVAFPPAAGAREVFPFPGPLSDFAVWTGKWAGGSFAHFPSVQAYFEDPPSILLSAPGAKLPQYVCRLRY